MESLTKYQTLFNIEEHFLAAMSTSPAQLHNSNTTSTTITTRKVIKKSRLKATSSQQMSTEETEQQQLLAADNVEISKMEQQQKSKQKHGKNIKKKTAITLMSTTSIENELELQQEEEKVHSQTQTQQQLQEKQKQLQQRPEQQCTEQKQQQQLLAQKITNIEMTTANDASVSNKKKLKGRKTKKTETDQQNISMKSSFSKFDALQKRNLIHNPQGEKEMNCRLCSKPVYKMEEIKAEKSIFHKNCFRCHECNKQLKVDNYQSHEGILYCVAHFKLLFSPRCVEDTEPEPIRKPELIVRENQPEELPPDVVRASDKPDLGLQELQQLNVRSRFQVFENPAQETTKPDERMQLKHPVHSVSLLSKLAKLQAQGVITDVSIKSLGAQTISQHYTPSDSDEGNSDVNYDVEDDENEGDDGADDADLVRSKKRTQRERPVGLGHAMNDIKTRFEKGYILSKEDRREERKQEIQNIRSRLFMGKQARIKEMYQQAVAESEHAITSSSKKPEIEIEGSARNLKERFETGDVFKDIHTDDDENVAGGVNGVGHRPNGMQNEADVFESAISKKSRSIFMELDANQAAAKNQLNTQLNRTFTKQHSAANKQRQMSENQPENVVKCDEKAEDVKIETSEISSKFKFFETYRPTEQKRKEFRITPPREGVVKMPTPEESDEKPQMQQNTDNEPHMLEKSQTTSIMLNKFRELETRKNHDTATGPRPLKCFTPPPDGGRRLYQEQDSDMDSQDDDDEEDEDDDDNEECDDYRRYCTHIDDEALKEAQAAARAKQLRAKFEKWEVNERQRELNEGSAKIYSEVSDDSNIESTKIIRERFENMQNLPQNQQPNRPRYQVNRFV